MTLLMKYTNLAAALNILTTRKLALLDPEHWDDRNDVHFMRRHREAAGIGAVRASCFTEARDTYHHWRIFAGQSDGVRLEIDKNKLLASIAGDSSIVAGSVKYLSIETFSAGEFAAADLPFIKRLPYQDELEFRIVRHLDKAAEASVPIRLSWIKSVAISPWMAPPLVKTVKHSLKAVDECARLKVYQSTVIDNREWRAAADRLEKGPTSGLRQ